jgi:thioredoxin-related protein
MERFIASLMVLLFLFSSSSRAQHGILFNELKDWNAVLERAKSSGKNIFVDVYTTWCGPCKMMDRNVYLDKDLGIYMDSNFVSIKIQMDVTSKDNDFIKSWRNDADNIVKSAKVNAYPTLLFYSPQGDLIYKIVGYRNTKALLSSVKFAISPEQRNYREDMLFYQDGRRDYSKLPRLIKATREFAEDRILAHQMALEYKKGYLDKLPSDELFLRENLEFIRDNGGFILVNTDDRIFKAAYNDPLHLDTILGKGTSEKYLEMIFGRVIREDLYKDEKPITTSPDWMKIKKQLKTKYPKASANELILKEQILFYRNIGNWDLYTRLKSESLTKYPPKKESMNVFFAYNSAAWDAFLNCDDKDALERALQWSKKSIDIAGKDEIVVQYIDTKANLLYKIGRVKEAIATEKNAIRISKENAKQHNLTEVPFLEEFEGNIKKMEEGLPTWKQ